MNRNDTLRFHPISFEEDELLLAKCMQLKVREDQTAFVDNPGESLIEVKKYPAAVPLAIMLKSEDKQEKVIGVIIYEHLDAAKTKFLIWDFMIDQDFQGKGYGKQTMLKLMDFLRTHYACQYIEIAYIKENTVVKNLYRGLGFKETGSLNDDGEVVMEYEF